MRPWAEISPGLSKTNSPDKTIPRSIWNDPGLQLQGKIGLAQLLKEDTIRKNPSFDSLVTARLEQLEKSNPNVTKVDLKAQAERDILEQWEQIETTIQTKAKVPQKRTAEQEAKRYADEHERYINRNDVPKVHQEIDIPKLEDELSLYQRNTNNNAKVNGLSYYERSARIEEIQAILNEHRTTEASKRFGAKPINEKDYQKLYEVSLGQVFGDPT
jgi:cell envelope opacity-associated protein A